jgi:hypothetical protein
MRLQLHHIMADNIEPVATRGAQHAGARKLLAGNATVQLPAEVAIIMGSDSDLPMMAPAARVLKDFGVPCSVTIVSAHRTPERMFEFARKAHTTGIKVCLPCSCVHLGLLWHEWEES